MGGVCGGGVWHALWWWLDGWGKVLATRSDCRARLHLSPRMFQHPPTHTPSTLAGGGRIGRCQHARRPLGGAAAAGPARQVRGLLLSPPLPGPRAITRACYTPLALAPVYFVAFAACTAFAPPTPSRHTHTCVYPLFNIAATPRARAMAVGACARTPPLPLAPALMWKKQTPLRAFHTHGLRAFTATAPGRARRPGHDDHATSPALP